MALWQGTTILFQFGLLKYWFLPNAGASGNRRFVRAIKKPTVSMSSRDKGSLRPAFGEGEGSTWAVAMPAPRESSARRAVMTLAALLADEINIITQEPEKS